MGSHISVSVRDTWNFFRAGVGMPADSRSYRLLHSSPACRYRCTCQWLAGWHRSVSPVTVFRDPGRKLWKPWRGCLWMPRACGVRCLYSRICCGSLHPESALLSSCECRQTHTHRTTIMVNKSCTAFVVLFSFTISARLRE